MHICAENHLSRKVWPMFLNEVSAFHFDHVAIGHNCITSDKTTESDTFIQIPNWSKFAYIITVQVHGALRHQHLSVYQLVHL